MVRPRGGEERKVRRRRKICDGEGERREITRGGEKEDGKER
jgi:hypothetical protein